MIVNFGLNKALLVEGRLKTLVPLSTESKTASTEPPVLLVTPTYPPTAETRDERSFIEKYAPYIGIGGAILFIAGAFLMRKR